MKQILLRPVSAAVQINHIAHSLKCKETDSDRQRDMRYRYGRSGRQKAPDRIQNKVCIFEIAQKPQIADDIQHEKQLFMRRALFDQKSEGPVHQDGKQHQEQIHRLSPGIKQEAEDEQEIVLQARPADDQAQYKDERQKEPEKGHGAEDHGVTPLQ